MVECYSQNAPTTAAAAAAATVAIVVAVVDLGPSLYTRELPLGLQEGEGVFVQYG